MTFTVYGEPQGKARPRFTKSGRTYTPKNTVDYEKSIKDAFLKNMGELQEDGGITVDVYAYYKIPKSASKKTREKIFNSELLPTKRPDVDNILKCVCDALNGVAYKDDAQVVHASVHKFYSDEPKIDVYIENVYAVKFSDRLKMARRLGM